MGQTTLRSTMITVPAKGYGETLPLDGKTDGQRFTHTGLSQPLNTLTQRPVMSMPLFQLPESLRRVLTTSGNLGRPSGSGGLHQPGTLATIPHPRDDEGEDITNPDAIARATNARWLLTIHRGDMIFNIRGTGHYEISKDTIKDLVSNLERSAEPEKIGTAKGPNPCYSQ